MAALPIRSALALALTALPAAAPAHDSWFETRAAHDQVALGTGVHYPVQETPIAAEYVPQTGCLRADGQAAGPMRAGALDAHSLRWSLPAAAASCWAQVQPFDIDLPADKIGLYLSEVRPDAATLALWADRQARGLPWRERYTKHARISLGDGSAADALPAPMGMDVLIESRSPWRFRVLRDGQPLAALAVELRSDRGTLGFWRRTDAEGRVSFQPPWPGAWLLRAVDLRPAAADTWDSRFVTLAFTAGTAPGVKTAAP